MPPIETKKQPDRSLSQTTNKHNHPIFKIVNWLFKICLTQLKLLMQLKLSILKPFKVVLRVVPCGSILIGARIWVGTPHNIERKSLAAGGWVRAAAGAGGRKFCQIIMPLRGSILQAETCQIPSLAENPRWSRVWQ